MYTKTEIGPQRLETYKWNENSPLDFFLYTIKAVIKAISNAEVRYIRHPTSVKLCDRECRSIETWFKELIAVHPPSQSSAEFE